MLPARRARSRSGRRKKRRRGRRSAPLCFWRKTPSLRRHRPPGAPAQECAQGFGAADRSPVPWGRRAKTAAHVVRAGRGASGRVGDAAGRRERLERGSGRTETAVFAPEWRAMRRHRMPGRAFKTRSRRCVLPRALQAAPGGPFLCKRARKKR